MALLLAATSMLLAASTVPTVTLNNGVAMPVAALVSQRTCPPAHQLSVAQSPNRSQRPAAALTADCIAALQGTAGYDNATSTAAVNLALSLGLTHVHTAYDYFVTTHAIPTTT